ncbi:unnamed protein product, partial [Phaeothamnion confervicola]
ASIASLSGFPGRSLSATKRHGSASSLGSSGSRSAAGASGGSGGGGIGGDGIDAVVCPGMVLILISIRSGAGDEFAVELASLPPVQACHLLQEYSTRERVLVLADPAPGDDRPDGAAVAAELARGRRTPPYTVTVTVAAARNLRRADIVSSDPFVVLRLAGAVARTRVKENTRSPTWEETFTFTMLSRDCDLVAQIWDHDSFSSDDPLGEVVVPLGDSNTFVVNVASRIEAASKKKSTAGGAMAAAAAAEANGAAVGAAAGGCGGASQEHDKWWDVEGGSGQLRLRIRIDQNIRLQVLPKEHRVAAMVLQRAIRAFAARRARQASFCRAQLSAASTGSAPPTAAAAELLKLGAPARMAPALASVISEIEAAAARRRRPAGGIAAAQPPIT